MSLVSLEGDAEVARVAGLFDPHNLTFSPDGSLLYVANLGADHVSVIDVATPRSSTRSGLLNQPRSPARRRPVPSSKASST